MSGNHKKSLKRALKIVDIAADSGANAIKLQTFKPEKVTLNLKSQDFIINDKTSPWYKKKFLNFFRRLIRHGNGIKFFKKLKVVD